QHDRRIPRDLETIVHKVLAKDPKDRCDKASELRDELHRFLDGRPTRWRRVGPVEQFRRWCKRNRWLAAATLPAAPRTPGLAVGTTIAAWVYRDQLHKLHAEQGKTQASLTRALSAERKAQLELANSLVAQGAALQRSRLIGQRFESLKRLDQAAKLLRSDPE